MENASARHTKVFLVEDSVPIRAKLARMIGALDGVLIVGEADTAASAMLGIAHSRPHVVVLDIRLRVGSGLDVLKEASRMLAATVFIMLTNDPTDQHRKICMAAGAAHFLDKNNEFGQVAEIIAQLKPTPERTGK